MERGGSTIIMLIARNPTLCIYVVFLFSAGGGGISLYSPYFLHSFLGRSGLGSGNGGVGASL